MKRDYRVIDSDSHVLEPADLWQKYMEPKFRAMAPHMEVDGAGMEEFHVEAGNVVKLGTMIPNNAFAAVGGIGLREGTTPQGSAFSVGKPVWFDPSKRIPDMDAEGID